MKILNPLYYTALVFIVGCTGRSTNDGTQPTPVQQPETEKPVDKPIVEAEKDPKEEENPGVTDTDDEIVVADKDKPITSTPPATPPVTPPVTPPAGPNAQGNLDIQGSSVVFQDVRFTVPAGWKVHQDTYTDGTLILALEKGEEYFRIYARKGVAPTLQSFFVNGSQVVRAEREEKIGNFSWKRIDTKKGQVSVAGFALNHNGTAYFGFGRSASSEAATTAAQEFLGSTK